MLFVQTLAAWVSFDIGFSLPRKCTHLSDDKTVAKMGHPADSLPDRTD
jgi:hypothetical protein